MKLNELKQIEKSKWLKINSAFGFTTIVTGIPLLINAIGSMVGLLKAAFSTSGEIKDKAGVYKWDNSKANSVNTKGFNIY
ncbi:hypothetical protein [Mycoplasmopsis cynos]|uniref:Uncharacterized protein n=1 Tax=Mycoplasmopsis cynos TaxID=171284 RepID=A0A449AHT0_9BACT|nr:hypothetical protein [Mycoplasmopsis cynos]TQC54976.1 hypothetical protein E1I74_00570 [Mycoplasmopsis cynos]VEU64557.1 Uncharacterised protein [Mycoplasmopsis cynos]